MLTTLKIQSIDESITILRGRRRLKEIGNCIEMLRSKLQKRPDTSLEIPQKGDSDF